MTEAQNNFMEFSPKVPENVQLVAVSKTQSTDKIQAIYDLGQRAFGENKALELRDKFHELPKDIEWHMIGHLQRNKVKYIAPFVHLIHSVDNLRLLQEINKEAIKNGRVIDCLLQVHIAQEKHKYGIRQDDLVSLLELDEFKSLQNVRIVGVMGMATFTNEKSVIKKEFQLLKKIFDQAKDEFFLEQDYFKQISMGMSGDFDVAIEEGSTMIRVGSKIFGMRNY